MTLVVRRVGADAATTVHAVVRAAFGARPPLDPPADATAETPETVGAALVRGGGLLATLEGHPVGALLMDPVARTVWLRRFGVVPAAQRLGVAGALVAEALSIADGDELAVVAREELPATIDFWRGHGFAETGRQPPYVELRRAVPRTYPAPDAAAMRELGRMVGGLVRAGDVVVLSGERGVGKTTFVQGLGGELGEASLDQAVTVVEWGSGIAEGLADARLEVRIARAFSDPGDPDVPDPRTVTLVPAGARWLGVSWPPTSE